MANKTKKYAVIGLVLFVLGYWIYQGFLPIPKEYQDLPLDRPSELDWVKGNQTNPKVTIVEYSDFQCPACKLYHELVNELAVKYASDAAIVYRHFPLKQMHLQAVSAAVAAEAAGKQGKFFEMHDLLFTNQEVWAGNNSAASKFEEYAKELNLDMDQYKNDVKSKELKGKVEAMYLNALQNRLNSTPSFFVNGQRIENPQGLQDFMLIIDEATKAAALNKG